MTDRRPLPAQRTAPLMSLAPLILLGAMVGTGQAATTPSTPKKSAVKPPAESRSAIKERGGVLVGANGVHLEYTLVSQSQCDPHAMKKMGLEAMKKAGATFDEQPWSQGLVAVVSSDAPQAASDIQTLARQQGQDLRQLDKKKDLKLCEDCVLWMSWRINGLVTSEAVPMKNGIALIATGKGADVVTAMHAMHQKELMNKKEEAPASSTPKKDTRKDK